MANSYSSGGSFGESRRNGVKRRSHIEILAAILRALASEYLTTNEVAIRVHLNWALAESYMKELSQKGHIESKKIGELTSYSATEAGVSWLKRFETLGP